MILKRGEIDDSSLYFILDGQYHLITDTGISIHNVHHNIIFRFKEFLVKLDSIHKS